jgi:hypothetical protein
MRSFIFLSIIFFCVNCSNNVKRPENKIDSTNEKKESLINKTLQDTCADIDKQLLKFSNEFKATAVNLNESISPEFKIFLEKLDTTCLRQQKSYKLFIATILAKLYVFHIHKLEVGSDLLNMKNGSGKIIITEFIRLLGYQNKRIEFFNSGTIVRFIKHDPDLKTNKSLNELIKRFEWD